MLHLARLVALTCSPPPPPPPPPLTSPTSPLLSPSFPSSLGTYHTLLLHISTTFFYISPKSIVHCQLCPSVATRKNYLERSDRSHRDHIGRDASYARLHIEEERKEGRADTTRSIRFTKRLSASMKTTEIKAALGAAILLLSIPAHAKHGISNLEVIERRHVHSRRARASPRAEAVEVVEKRSTQCAFPTDAGLVSVTPSEQNAGWAMSPDQPCEPGNYCPYACPAGQLSAQWDPEATSYTYPLSMVGPRAMRAAPTPWLIGARTEDCTAMRMATSRSRSRARHTVWTARRRWEPRTRRRARWPSARPSSPAMRPC